MLAKTIDRSVREITEKFPINLASRSTAFYISDVTDVSCESFMDAALVVDPLKTTICSTFDFTDTNTVQEFVADKWYNRSGAAIISKTGMTQT